MVYVDTVYLITRLVLAITATSNVLATKGDSFGCGDHSL